MGLENCFFFMGSFLPSIFYIATLRSIFDSQLSLESGKFQLARWGRNVALFLTRNHPPTHLQDIFFLTSTYPRKLRFGIQLNLTNLSCLGHLSMQHLSSSINFVWCPPWFWKVQCPPTPILRI